MVFATVIFLLAAYGIAWLLTESELIGEPAYTYLEKEKRNFSSWISIKEKGKPYKILYWFLEKLAELFSCTICMSAWTALGLVLLAPYTFLPTIGFVLATGILDTLIYIALAITTSYLIDSLT